MPPPTPVADPDAPSTPPTNAPEIQVIDEESSLSTATSLTSIITSHTPQTIRTGIDTGLSDRPPPREPQTDRDATPITSHRARSLSVPDSVILGPSNTPGGLIRSGSATRSNPRTRTPMRHASPLLVTGRLFGNGRGGANVNDGDDQRGGVDDNNDGDAMGEPIPEEDARGSEPTEPTVRAGHFLHRHRLSTAPSSTPTTHHQREKQMSSKQIPSHRKLRRWNNDRFIGTHSETSGVIHPVVVREGEEWYQEYWMPNYPREYRSEFARLVNDGTKRGQQVRDRFLKGEVGTVPVDIQSTIIPKQFQGISQKIDVGNQLYRKLAPRIRSILSRCCDTSSTTLDTSASNNQRSSLAIQAVLAFESYLASCTFQSKKSVIPSSGFPLLLSEEMYQVLDKVFCSPPDLVIRKNKRKTAHGVAAIPTIHFYFGAESQIDHSSKNGAFYRILLYAVCNFHGLVASSFTLDGKKKSIGSLGMNLGKGVKVVTVQGGVVLGPELKLLDYVGGS